MENVNNQGTPQQGQNNKGAQQNQKAQPGQKQSDLGGSAPASTNNNAAGE